MATNDPEKQVRYLLAALKTCKSFEPDYRALGLEMGMSNPNTAQKKFKAIVEKSGKYKLVNTRVVDNDDNNNSTTASSTTTTAPTSTSTTPAVSKKRKAPAGKADEPSTPEEQFVVRRMRLWDRGPEYDAIRNQYWPKLREAEDDDDVDDGK